MTTSWVIQNKETGEVIFETSLPQVVAALNTNKYQAIPIRQYLAALNATIKAERERAAQICEEFDAQSEVGDVLIMCAATIRDGA